MAGGGTWKIVVEEGQVKNATQSGVAGGTQVATKSSVAKPQNTELAKTSKQIAKGTLVLGMAVAKTGFNQYYSITGQGAQQNRMNVALTYSAVGLAIGAQIATGNFVGAAVTGVGAGVALANQAVSFQRNVTEQNAMAEYLRQQSGTSVNANRGELYSFRLF
jgi:hypothetical protein